MTIDKEFESLIPPLSAEEFAQLEENCLKEGIRDSLVIWDNNGDWILIDGHNRYKIAQKHNIPYNHRRMTFPNREAVKAWIIQNQFGRRNLSAYDRSVLALKLKPLIAEKAKEKQASHTEQGYQKSDKPVTTSRELAKVAGVSHDTIHKVEAIEKSGDETLKEQVRSGEVSINQGYRMVRGEQNKTPAQSQKEFIEQIKQEHDDFQKQKTEQTVSFADAVNDKKNQQIIANDLWLKCMKMGHQIEQIMDEARAGDIDLSVIKTLPEDKQTSLKQEIRNVIKKAECIYMGVFNE